MKDRIEQKYGAALFLEMHGNTRLEEIELSYTKIKDMCIIHGWIFLGEVELYRLSHLAFSRCSPLELCFCTQNKAQSKARIVTLSHFQ